MSTISIKNMSFAYDDSCENVFEDVSLEIDTHWKLGLIGRNGRGKTTLLNILKGNCEYSGEIVSNVDFEYFPFKVSDAGISAIEIIKTKANISDYDLWKIQREISLMGLDEDVLYKPFEILSGGEQVKILLVSLFLKENGFLLIDEPTNHLDVHAKETVCEYLKRAKKGFILVSHDRQLLDNCVDHILSINRANIELQKGNFTSWHENKQKQDNFELAKNDNLKKQISKLEKSARRTADWSNKVEKSKNGTRIGGLRPNKGYIGHKAAKMMKRSKVAESRQMEMIEEKSKLLKNIESAESLKLSTLRYHKSRLMSLKNVSLSRGDKGICEGVSFEVNRGDRIAICGENGCGKSTVLKFIMGDKNIMCRGEFYRGSNLKISYVPQKTSDLKGMLKDWARIKNIDESLLKSILRKFDFSREQFEKNMESFSEGQKKKVLIASSLCEEAHLYVWDEPLNFIDILSRIQIEELILKYSPTMIFVEHDEIFTKKIATKFIEI